MAGILGLFTLALFFSSLVAADQCSPESLPDIPPPRAIRRSFPSGPWVFSVSGRANSSFPKLSPLKGNTPTSFRVELPYSSLPELDPIGGKFYITSEESSPRVAIPLKQWNPKFHPGSRSRNFLRGSIAGRFYPGSNSLCAKVCFFRRFGGLNETRPRSCDALLSLHYPGARSIENLFVVGELRSLLRESDEWYFSPVSLVGVSSQEYEYTKLELAERSCGGSGAPGLEISHRNSSLCYSGLESLPLNISRSCGKKNSCYPFLDSNSSSSNSSLFFQELRCDPGGRVSGFLHLRDDPQRGHLVAGSWKNSLAVEGTWVGDRVCLIACQAGETSNPSSRDCSMLVTLEFPQVFSIHRRSPIVGNLSSLRENSDPLFFATIPFRAAGQMFRFYLSSQRSLSYSYSKIEEAMNQCPAIASSRNRRRGVGVEEFPSGKYFQDFSFLSSSPRSSVHQVSLNERLQDSGYFAAAGRGFAQVIFDPEMEIEKKKKENPMVNVSFDITFDGEFIAAEGFYDPGTGAACLIGCREIQIQSEKNDKKKNFELLEEGKDCRILVKMQYPSSSEKPGDRKISVAKSSLRKRSDELFFGTTTLYSFQSIYMAEAMQRVWIRKLEIFLGMIDLSLVLVGLIFQLLHARSQPKLRRYTSLMMLGVLILGHMVPLVLNFEALFDRSAEDPSAAALGDSSGESSLLQVKEVGIRLMNMAALLLLLWILQLVWSSRQFHQGDSMGNPSAELSSYRESEESTLLEENQDFQGTKGEIVREMSVLLVCVPLYGLGALATSLRQWILHKNLWSGLKSYAGLTLDLFLVPQALAYSIWGVQARGVSAGFCVGMTIARVLPHAFDIYRASRPASLELVRDDFFFADGEWDFFSLAWDITIPCVGIFVAAVVLLQQRFGGRFFIPRLILNMFR